MIAAVNGPALGAGLGLAASCDIILCSDNAQLGMPEIDVGLAGGAAMLQTLFGRSRARRMFYTGWRVPADELYRTGVVECCVPLDQLMPEAMKIATDIASKSPIGMRYAKQSMNTTMHMPRARRLSLRARRHRHAEQDRRRTGSTPRLPGKAQAGVQGTLTPRGRDRLRQRQGIARGRLPRRSCRRAARPAGTPSPPIWKRAAGSPTPCSPKAIPRVRDRPVEAEHFYRRAIHVWPGFFEAISNLGEALVEQLRLPEALAMFRTALTLRPADANSGFAYAVTLLLSGDLAEGWRHFESRRTMAAWHYDRRHELPHWQEGVSIQDRHLLLMAEQGIGDVIQFARYATLLCSNGIAVTLEVPPALLPLFQSMPGPRAVITPDQPASGCDLACPLMSLPLLCGTTPDTIPPNLPQPRIPRERIAMWQDWLGATRGRRIGLVCSGDPRNPTDATRRVPFAELTPLLSLPNHRFVLLQQEIRDTDTAAIDAAPDLLQPRSLLRDFADTAAIISQLDLVIAADTGVAHLAATLGLPVWLLLPYRPDWRWMLHRRDSPWYPTMTLYRQPTRGTWAELVQAVRRDLV